MCWTACKVRWAQAHKVFQIIGGTIRALQPARALDIWLNGHEIQTASAVRRAEWKRYWSGRGQSHQPRIPPKGHMWCERPAGSTTTRDLTAQVPSVLHIYIHNWFFRVFLKLKNVMTNLQFILSNHFWPNVYQGYESMWLTCWWGKTVN